MDFIMLAYASAWCTSDIFTEVLIILFQLALFGLLALSCLSVCNGDPVSLLRALCRSMGGGLFAENPAPPAES